MENVSVIVTTKAQSLKVRTILEEKGVRWHGGQKLTSYDPFARLSLGRSCVFIVDGTKLLWSVDNDDFKHAISYKWFMKKYGKKTPKKVQPKKTPLPIVAVTVKNKEQGDIVLKMLHKMGITKWYLFNTSILDSRLSTYPRTLFSSREFDPHTPTNILSYNILTKEDPRKKYHTTFGQFIAEYASVYYSVIGEASIYCKAAQAESKPDALPYTNVGSPVSYQVADPCGRTGPATYFQEIKFDKSTTLPNFLDIYTGESGLQCFITTRDIIVKENSYLLRISTSNMWKEYKNIYIKVPAPRPVYTRQEAEAKFNITIKD